MAKLFMAANGATPTTAAITPVTTGTTIKTLLQIKPGTSTPIRVVEWGISFDGTAVATPGRVELVETDVAATVTSFNAADINSYNDPNTAVTSSVSRGTSASGYTSSNEGTPTAVRLFDVQLLSPTSNYSKQFPLGREPEVAVSKFLRVRVTFAAAINAYAYVIWEE